MYGQGKGISKSSMPYKKVPPRWLSIDSSEVTKLIENLAKKGLAPEIPEDLYHLMKKAVAMRKHIEKNHRDKDSKYRLILVESKIHRLVRYYKLTKQIPANWKYDYQTALALVS